MASIELDSVEACLPGSFSGSLELANNKLDFLGVHSMGLFIGLFSNAVIPSDGNIRRRPSFKPIL